MEIVNINKFYSIYENNTNSPGTQNSLKGILTLDANSSINFLFRINPDINTAGIWRLNGVRLVYLINFGTLTTITARINQIIFNNGEPDTVTPIAVNNSGYNSTIGVNNFGTTILSTPAYISTSLLGIYRFEVTFTSSTPAMIEIAGVNVNYSTRRPTDNIGNTLRVDMVFGNNSIASRQGNPYSTISAAIANALPGDTILINSGVYNESFTIPNSVTIRGVTAPLLATTTSAGTFTNGGGVIIQQTNVTANTDLITMGEVSRLEDVTLYLHSTSHVQLRGLIFPGTSTQTSRLRTVNVIVDNSTASTTGTSNVYGIYSNGTGRPTESQSAVRACAIGVRSAGLGNKRGILVDTANTTHIRDTNVIVTNLGGAGSYIAAEVNNSGGILGLRMASISGTSADVSQTSGTLLIGSSCNLLNANANGFGFTTLTIPMTFTFGDPGRPPSGTYTMYPGTINSVSGTSARIGVRLIQKAVCTSISVNVGTAPGTGITDTWTILRNGIATSVIVTLIGTQTSATSTNISASFAMGDILGVQGVRAGSSLVADIIVTVTIF